MSASRRALEPPPGPVIELSDSLMRTATDYARNSDRKRVIQPLHQHHGELLHRMLNAAQPGTYVRPHRHLHPPKAEAFVLLQGAADFVVFDDDGALSRVSCLREDSAVRGVDVAPGPFHCFVARAPDTVLYEVKTGPYEASSDKDFAAWSPEEATPEANVYLQHLTQRIDAWVAANIRKV